MTEPEYGRILTGRDLAAWLRGMLPRTKDCGDGGVFAEWLRSALARAGRAPEPISPRDEKTEINRTEKKRP